MLEPKYEFCPDFVMLSFFSYQIKNPLYRKTVEWQYKSLVLTILPVRLKYSYWPIIVFVCIITAIIRKNHWFGKHRTIVLQHSGTVFSIKCCRTIVLQHKILCGWEWFAFASTVSLNQSLTRCNTKVLVCGSDTGLLPKYSKPHRMKTKWLTMANRETKVLSRREGLNLLFSDQIIRRSSVHPLAVRMVPLYRFRPVWQYTTMVLSYSDGILKFTVAKTCRIPYNSSIQTNKRKENAESHPDPCFRASKQAGC